MKHSESITNIVRALVEVQKSLGGGVVKDAENPHFKSSYTSLGMLLGTATTLLAANGLVMAQDVRGIDHGIEIITTLLHTSGEWIEYEPLPVPVVKNDAQGYGSSITYGRRYSAQAALGLASLDDDGNEATKAAPPNPPVRLITATQESELRALVEETASDE